MQDTLIQKNWEALCRYDSKLLATGYQPLSHIGPFLSFFNLPERAELDLTTEPPVDLASVKPVFKNLTGDLIFSLRCRLYNQTAPELVAKWAENSMRFCEVRLSGLKKRTTEIFKTQKQARENILHLAVFLTDYAAFTGDLRFLNTVLKLTDVTWLFKQNAPDFNSGKAQPGETELFEFRVLLAVESLMGRFAEDQKK